MKSSQPATPSLALHVAVLVGVTIAICFFILGLLVQRSVLHHFAEQDADELRVVADAVQKAIGGNESAADRNSLASRLDRAVSGHHGIYFAVFNNQGIPIYTGQGPDLSPLIKRANIVKEIRADLLQPWTIDNHEYHGAVIAPESLAQIQGGIRIAVAVTTDFHREFIKNFSGTLWALMLISGILAISASWIAIRIGHRPLHRVSEEIQSINTQQLNRRLDTRKVPKELRELVLSFNKMISDVEENFRKLSQFSADIAHELRTPITNLSTQTQVALNKERSVKEYRDILYSNLEDYERLGTMIRDLLWLAQTDNKLLTLTKTSLNLNNEVDAVIEYFEPWAEERQVKLKLVGGSVSVEADRNMLRRALNNLVANAVSHCPPDGQVAVTVSAHADHAMISVENSGEEIDKDHLSRIFDRFYRIDSARGRSAGEGVGLGLSIVKSIITLHQGEITVTSNPEKTCFSIKLPF